MAEEEKKRKDRKRETWLVAWGRKFNIGAKREKNAKEEMNEQPMFKNE